MKQLPRFFSAFALPAVATVLSSCVTQSGGGPVSIKKVQPYHLHPGVELRTEDRMIRFEYAHRTHGAITTEDYAARYGNYFTVHWRNQNRGTDLTVRIEYTQAKTGADVKTKEVNIPNAGGRGATEIQIVGAEYAANGPVNSWRVTLIQGGQVIAEDKSFLWK